MICVKGTLNARRYPDGEDVAEDGCENGGEDGDDDDAEHVVQTPDQTMRAWDEEDSEKKTRRRKEK